MSTPTVGTYLYLVEIKRGAKVFRMVASGKEFQFNGDTYAPADLVFKEATMRSGSKGSAEGFNIQIPMDSEAAEYLKLPMASSPVDVALMLVSDTGVQKLIIRGTLINTSKESRMMTITVGSIKSQLGYLGLSRKYTPTCSHSLYDSGCKVSNTVVALPVSNELRSVSGGGHLLILQVSTLPHIESYSEGYLTATVNDTELFSSITKIVIQGSEALIFIPNNLGVRLIDKTVNLHRGCDLTFKTCHTVFNNTKNFGGFPFFIGKDNPFTNNSLDS